MVETKDKVVTVESLSTLHEYNTNTYMTKINPISNGSMAFDGDAVFSGSVNTNSLEMSNVKLVYEDGSFKIVFLDENN